MLLDGDAKKESKNPQKEVIESPDNTLVFLPELIRPEDVINNFLKNLPENDPFWDNDIKYTKPVYLNGAPRLSATKKDREVMKEWWKAELSKWGPDGERVFSRWRELNHEAAIHVVHRTRSVVRKIIDNYFKLKSS